MTATDAFDVARARRDTPACERRIHFNNAGASLMPAPVLRTVVAQLQREAEIGGYEAADEAAARVEGFYDSCAALLGCDADEIAFTDSATRAWDLVFYSLPLAAGDRILTSRAEYASNFIAYLQVSRRHGVRVDVVPDDASGQLDVAALRERIDPSVKLISVTHVPTNGGLVNPAAEIGRVARDAGVPFLLDACQSVGQLPIDVDRIGCDFLAATGRKYLRGPRGTGLLYVRRAWIGRVEPVMLDLHAAEWTAPREYRVREDARRFETWERSVAGQLGLGAAIDYALAWGVDAIADRIQRLAERLRAGLGAIPGVTVTDLGDVRCGIVTLRVDGIAARSVRTALAARGINLSVSEASSTLIDMRARGYDAVVRASVHYFNTEAEVDRFCAEIERLRPASR